MSKRWKIGAGCGNERKVECILHRREGFDHRV